MNWLPVTIGDVCLPILQGDPVRIGRRVFRYIDVAGVDRNSKLIVRADQIEAENAPSRARKIVHANDVIVSTVRPNLNAVALVPEALHGEIASTAFAVLRANDKLIHPEYLFYWVQSRQFVDFLTINATGASYPAVTEGIIKRSKLNLPTPSEQARIVELLKEADRLRHLRRYTDAQAASILPTLFNRMFGDPVSNPMRWPEEPLSEVIPRLEAGWSALGEGRARQAGELGVLKISAVTSGVFRPEENKAVSEVEFSRPLLMPKRGDLLFSRANTRELIAASCVVDDDYPDLFLSDKLWRLIPDSRKASVLYLKELFWKEGVRDKFRAVSSGSSGSMLNISQDAMLRTLVPLPPIELQKKFEHIAWGVMEKLKAAQNAAKHLDKVWVHMLENAFLGKLTGHWRTARMHELVAEMEEWSRIQDLPSLREEACL